MNLKRLTELICLTEEGFFQDNLNSLKDSRLPFYEPRTELHVSYFYVGKLEGARLRMLDIIQLTHNRIFPSKRLQALTEAICFPLMKEEDFRPWNAERKTYIHKEVIILPSSISEHDLALAHFEFQDYIESQNLVAV